MLISIGILAHNEEHDIGTLISDLAKQNLLSNNALSIDIHVVANGCTDQTVSVSKAALSPAVPARNISTFMCTTFGNQENRTPGMNSSIDWHRRKPILSFASMLTFEYQRNQPFKSFLTASLNQDRVRRN